MLTDTHTHSHIQKGKSLSTVSAYTVSLSLCLSVCLRISVCPVSVPVCLSLCLCLFSFSLHQENSCCPRLLRLYLQGLCEATAAACQKSRGDLSPFRAVFTCCRFLRISCMTSRPSRLLKIPWAGYAIYSLFCLSPPLSAFRHQRHTRTQDSPLLVCSFRTAAVGWLTNHSL